VVAGAGFEPTTFAVLYELSQTSYQSALSHIKLRNNNLINKKSGCGSWL